MDKDSKEEESKSPKQESKKEQSTAEGSKPQKDGPDLIDELTGSVESKDKKQSGRPLKDIDEGRRISVSVAFSPKLLDKVIEESDKSDVSRSELINKAVAQYFEKSNPELAPEIVLERNRPMLEILSKNRAEGQYACEYLGDHFKELLPIHPEALLSVKQILSQRGGSYSDDYQELLKRAAKSIGISKQELEAKIDSAIENNTALSEQSFGNEKEEGPDFLDELFGLA